MKEVMKPIAIHFKKYLMLPGSSAHSKQTVQLNVYKHIEVDPGPYGVLVVDTTRQITALVPFESIESIVYEGTPTLREETDGSPKSAA